MMKVQHRIGVVALYLSLVCMLIFLYTESIEWLPIFILSSILGVVLFLADE